MLDGPPRGYLAYMPTAIEGRFMSIVCIERYGVQIAGVDPCRLLPRLGF